MNEIYLKKLWDVLQNRFDVGTYDEFKSHMTTTEQRKKFYDAVNAKNFDIGPYDAFEAHLSGQLIPLHNPNQQEFRDQMETKWHVCQDGFPDDGIAYGCKSTTIRVLKHLLGLNDVNDGVYGNQFLKLLGDNGIITPDQAEQYQKDHSFKVTKDVYNKIYHMKHPTSDQDALKSTSDLQQPINEVVKINLKKALKELFQEK